MQYKILNLTKFNVTTNNNHYKNTILEKQLDFFSMGATSQVRKRCFTDIQNNLNSYAQIDFGIKTDTVSGGGFLRHRLLEACCWI